MDNSMIRVGTIKVDKVQMGDNWRIVVNPEHKTLVFHYSENNFTTFTEIEIPFAAPPPVTNPNPN